MNKEYFQRIAGIKPKASLNEHIGGVISLQPLKEMNFEDEEEEEDLFDDWENLPEEPKALYLKWSKVLGGDDGEYEGMDRYKMVGIMQDEFEELGYTFDWGLDGEPYGLKQMNEGEPDDEQYDGEYDAESGPAITSELEKPKSIYVTDDSEDEEGFIVPGDDNEEQLDYNRAYEIFGMPIEKIVKDMIDDGFEPEEAIQFLRDMADQLEGGNIFEEGEEDLKPSGELEW